MALTRRSRVLSFVAAGAAVAIVLGAYAGAVAGGERGSFVMNFPAEGAAAGGPSMRELTGLVVVSLDGAGIIKRLVQPDVIEVASHVVSNVGDTPRRIRFEVEGLTDEMEWHSRDRSWNPETHEIEREIAPGESVDFGLVVTLPDPLPEGVTPIEGTIAVVDAETGERLSELPVKFVREGFVAGGACCE